MPDSIISTAKDAWAVLLGLGGLVVWFVRLEARAKSNSADVKRYREELKDHIRDQKERRAEDLAAQQRDHQAVQAQLNSIHKDIRELLQRTVK